MITIILLILLLISMAAIGALSYACYNLLKKVEIYEEWVDTFEHEINSVHQRLKEVDDKNLFDKDDDVGFVFSEILRIVSEFNERIK